MLKEEKSENMLKNIFEMELWIQSKMKTTKFGNMYAVWNGSMQI